MTDRDPFHVKFWGVRGSIACPGPGTVRYGGNTTCLEIRCGSHLLVIDGGTGMRPLGSALLKERPSHVDVLFTHTHFDHVVGVPFFQPAYYKDVRVTFWAGHLLPETTLQAVLCDMMMAPLFPVPLHIFQSCEYRDFTAGDRFEIKPGVVVSTCPLNHPNRATGYRVDFGGRSLAVITDTEHVPDSPDNDIVQLVRDCDAMIYDSMFTDEEFPRFRKWGHSTWQECLRIADAANVRLAVPFHHDPNHDDDFMDRVADEAAAARPGTIVAKEGDVLHL